MANNKSDQVKEIQLDSNPKSPYSILTAMVFLLLILGSIALFSIFQDRLGVAIAICIIPLAFAFFILKLLLWNIGGTEQIKISSDKTEVYLVYPYFFRSMMHAENSRMKMMLFRTNTQSELIKPQEILDLRLSNSLYKLHLEFSNGNTYLSSISFGLDEAKRIVNLVRS